MSWSEILVILNFLIVLGIAVGGHIVMRLSMTHASREIQKGIRAARNKNQMEHSS